MANSTQARTNPYQIFLQRRTAKRAKSTLFAVMPFLEMMTGLTEGKKSGADGLGRLASGNLSFGRINGASMPRREKLFREREYLPIWQTTKPAKSEVKKMGDYDNDPTVPSWETTNRTLARFQQPRFKFSRSKMPCKIAHSEMRMASPGSGSPEAQAAQAIGEVYDVENKSRLGVLCEQLNDELFGINGESGAPADEDEVTWDSMHSISNALGTTNTYGGIDRSDAENAWWRGKRYTDTWTGTFEALIDYCNYDFEHLKYGLGVQIIMVGGQLMKRAKAEAKTEQHRLINVDHPDPKYGFAREMVAIGSGNRISYVVYDPAMDVVDTATGKKNAYCIDPSTWTVAIPSDRNFKNSKILRLNEVDEGGDEADAWNIEHEMLICCEVPQGNAIFEDIQ